MTAPKCFISYSWESAEHKDWVRLLAVELQSNGIDTYLDQWDIHLGADLTKYMEASIRESDYVLLICTPIYARKTNARHGGVGYEQAIVTGEIFEGVASPKKFVPLLRRGSQEESLPSYLKSRAYLDFRDDGIFSANLEELLRHLHESPKHPRPPLGPKPVLNTLASYNQSTIKSNSDNEASTIEVQTTSLPLERLKELIRFAYSGEGLNLSSEEAKEWAVANVNLFSEDAFEIFKEKFEAFYKLASSKEGFDLADQSAREWAFNRARGATNDDDVTDLKILFDDMQDFASSYLGLYMTKEHSKEWARAIIHHIGAEEEFEQFKTRFEELREFAEDSDGLSLSDKDAMVWAVDTVSQEHKLQPMLSKHIYSKNLTSEAHKYDRRLRNRISVIFISTIALTVGIPLYVFAHRISLNIVSVLLPLSIVLTAVFGASYLKRQYQFKEEKITHLMLLTFRLIPLLFKSRASSQRRKSTKSKSRKQ